MLLEFVADGVDYPIGQQTEEEVCVRVLIALVVYGAQFKVRLQLAIARLNFTNKIVVFPGRTLVKRTDVGAQEVSAETLLSLFLIDSDSPLFSNSGEKAKEYSRITAIVLHICLLLVAEARPNKFLASLQIATGVQSICCLTYNRLEVNIITFRLTFV